MKSKSLALRKGSWDYYPNGNAQNPFLILPRGMSLKYDELLVKKLNHIKEPITESPASNKISLSIVLPQEIKSTSENIDSSEISLDPSNSKIPKDGDPLDKKSDPNTKLTTASVSCQTDFASISSSCSTVMKKSEDLVQPRDKILTTEQPPKTQANRRRRQNKKYVSHGPSSFVPSRSGNDVCALKVYPEAPDKNHPSTKRRLDTLKQSESKSKFARKENQSIFKPPENLEISSTRYEKFKEFQVKAKKNSQIPIIHLERSKRPYLQRTNVNDAVQENKSNFHKKIERKADEHLRFILANLGLDSKWYFVMSKHQINYLRFLKLTKNDLHEIGMTKLTEINKVMTFITETLDNSSCHKKGLGMAQSMSSGLTAGEVEARVKDMTLHLRRLSDRTNDLKTKIKEDPSGLQFGNEVYPISKIIQNLNEIVILLEINSLDCRLLEDAFSRATNMKPERVNTRQPNQMEISSYLLKFSSIAALGIFIRFLYTLRKK